MVKNQFSTVLALAVSFALSACVTQNFENGETPVVENQSNRNDMAATRISLGLGYLKMGNMPQAKQNLEKAKNFSPNMVQVYTAFAHYYETVGEHKLTIESYEHALSIKSDDADTLNNYGVYLCRQDQIDAAEEQFLKAIAVPTYLLVSKSYENLASCFLQKDNFDKAEQYLNKAIMHSPSNASILYQMVRLQYAMGEYQQAKHFEQRFEKVTRRFTPQSLALAFKVYSKLGQKRTAKNYGTMLVKMYPQSWEAQQYLLNELELIDADNLAKRYLLTQAKEQDNKPKKRIVKLSPKKTAPNNTVVNAQKSSQAPLATQKGTVQKSVATPVLVAAPAIALTPKPSISIASTQSINDALSMAPVTDTHGKTVSTAAESKTNLVDNTQKALIADGSEKPVMVLTAADAGLNNEANTVGKATNTSAENAELLATDAAIGIEVQSVEPVVNTATENAELLATDAAIGTKVQSVEPVVNTAAGNAELLAADAAIGTEVQSVEPVVNTSADNLELVDSQVVSEEVVEVKLEDMVNTSSAENEVLQETIIAESTVQELIPAEDREIFHVAKKPEPIVENSAKEELANAQASGSNSPVSGKPPEKVTKKPATHTVAKGDTLYGISIKYNVKIKAIRSWNNLSTKKKIRINDTLFVENPTAVTQVNE